jgi:cytochrome P450
MGSAEAAARAATRNCSPEVARRDDFPLGAGVTLEQLETAPHALLARLREREPVSWIPALNGWLVTSYELALQVMRDAERFTVDDPRFSTARVVGASMLSLDGDEHAAHRAPFVGPFRPAAVRERFAAAADADARRLLAGLRAAGAAELRRSFAGPLAAGIVARALGLELDATDEVLRWYDAIVAGVTEVTAGKPIPPAAAEAFTQLEAQLKGVIARPGSGSLLASVAASAALDEDQIVSNAAVLLFGGIETTEGMIANAALHLLENPSALERNRREPQLLDAAIEESLRLEPAAAVIDRYATAAVNLAQAEIAPGELVRISIAAANRDPAIFAEPDRFDPDRGNGRRHLAFAHGPHVCVGVHLARLEARAGLRALFEELPGIRLDPARPSRVRGLVFRKPQTLHVVWNV